MVCGVGFCTLWLAIDGVIARFKLLNTKLMHFCHPGRIRPRYEGKVRGNALEEWTVPLRG